MGDATPQDQVQVQDQPQVQKEPQVQSQKQNQHPNGDTLPSPTSPPASTSPPPSTSTSPSRSITIHHRTTRTTTTLLMHPLLKKIVPLLLFNKGDPQPEGSPKLDPHKAALKRCRVSEERVEGVWVYRFARKEGEGSGKGKGDSNKDSDSNSTPNDKAPVPAPAQDSLNGQNNIGVTGTATPRRDIYYFAGGGFRMPASKEQWSLCAELCLKLPSCYTIHLVSYPLAPKNTAPTALDALQRMYRALAAKATREGSGITLMGDSSGGNIALVLGIYGAGLFLGEGVGEMSAGAAEGEGEGDKREGEGKGVAAQMQEQKSICPLRNILAISPTTDFRHEHPSIRALAPKDPVLTLKTITDSADVWHGAWPLSDPRLSPSLADLSVLKRARVKVDGVTAGYDILTPEALVFREKLNEIGVQGDWLHWEKQMHCFPITFSYGIGEAVGGKEWILGVLRKNVGVESD